MKLPKPSSARRLFFALSALILLLVLSYVIFRKVYPAYPVNLIDDVFLNDLIKAAIEVRLEQTKSLFELGLLLLGALWALLIAKKDEARIVLSDRPEVGMFLCASTLLLLSLLCHLLYAQEITDILSLAGKLADEKPSLPDIFNSNINYLFLAQCWFLVGGLVVAVLTLVSAHKLKT